MSSRRVVLAGAIAFALTGCAGVWQPYVLPYEAIGVNVASCSGRGTAGGGSATGSGFQCAQALQAQLASKLQDHALLDSISGSALLPLASLVAYKGVYDSNAHNVAALAAGGFAAYGVAQYLTSHPRELIYVSGIGALDCAMMVSVTPADTALADIERQSNAVDTVIAEAAASATRAGDALSKLKLRKANGVDADALQQKAAAFERAASMLQARRLAVHFRILRARHASVSADAELRVAALRIVGEVNKQIALLTPDPKSIQSQLSALALPTAPAPAPAHDSDTQSTASEDKGPLVDVQLAKIHVEQGLSALREQIHDDEQESQKASAALEDASRAFVAAGADETAKQTHADRAAKAKAQLARINNELDRERVVAADMVILRSALVEMVSSEQKLMSATEAVKAMESTSVERPPLPVNAYSACGLDPTALPSAPLTLGESTVSMTAKSVAHVSITGGNGFYKTFVAKPPADPKALVVAVSNTSPGSGQLDITAGDLKKDEKYTIVVTSDHDNKASLTLTITD